MATRARVQFVGFAAMVAIAATALVVACSSDDASVSASCEGAACDGGASETSPPDGPPREDGSVARADGSTDGPSGTDADSAIVVHCGDAGTAGTLDETFGEGGVVWLEYPGATANAVAVQADGKIVIAGNASGVALVRLMPNGLLDTSFGSGGLVDIALGDAFNNLSAVALQPDGKIVAAGSARSNGETADFAVLRYMPDGGLDPSFGNGGTVLTNLGALQSAYAESLAIQTDGRILVGGYMDVNGMPSATDYALARYNANGSLDATFATGGVLTVDVRGTADSPGAIMLVSGGKIVVAGGSKESAALVSRSDISAVRLSSSGATDVPFGDGGKVVTSFGGTGSHRALAGLEDELGRVVLAGSLGSPATKNDFAVVRLLPSGSLDTTFGDAGLVTTDYSGRGEQATRVLRQHDGKLVLAGTSSNGPVDTNAIALARYLPSGGLDPTFGAGGTSLTLPPQNAALGVQSATLTPCHIVVVGGWTYNLDSAARSAMGIARFHR